MSLNSLARLYGRAVECENVGLCTCLVLAPSVNGNPHSASVCIALSVQQTESIYRHTEPESERADLSLYSFLIAHRDTRRQIPMHATVCRRVHTVMFSLVHNNSTPSMCSILCNYYNYCSSATVCLTHTHSHAYFHYAKLCAVCISKGGGGITHHDSILCCSCSPSCSSPALQAYGFCLYFRLHST